MIRVGHLRKILEGVDDNVPLVLSYEHAVVPVHEISTEFIYVPYSEYHGELFISELTTELEEGGEPCITFLSNT